MDFNDMSDDDKKALLDSLKSQQSPDEGLAINPEMNSNRSDISDVTPIKDDTSQNSLKFNDNNKPLPSLVDNAQEALGLYDNQVANRPRAAVLAALRGNSPIDAAINNDPASGEDIAREGFKTLNPEITQTTNPSNVLMKKGQALEPAVPLAGMAAASVLDPATYIGGAGKNAGSLLERFGPQIAKASEKLPLAERASAPFIQKTAESAPNFSNRVDQYAHMQNAAKDARDLAMKLSETAPYSTEAKIANAKAFKLQNDFDKYKNMFNKQ